MADNETTTRFPYQHLAVLGMEKLKKYVPPASTNATSRASSQRIDAVTNASATKRADKK